MFGLGVTAVGLGGLILVDYHGDAPENVSDEQVGWEYYVFSRLGLRTISRLSGAVADLQLPLWARAPLFRAYGWAFDVDFSDYRPDLDFYQSFYEFFKRKLDYPRECDDNASFVSPADGILQSFGQVPWTRDGRLGRRLEQIKGVSYNLDKFLGVAPEVTGDNGLYYAVIYLPPGGYHRFHASTEWNVEGVRHFPGDLFPVNNYFSRKLPGLFSLNERVVMFGKRTGQYGNEYFHSLTAVGALNVGSIELSFDSQLHTNMKRQDVDAKHYGQSGNLDVTPYPGRIESTNDCEGIDIAVYEENRGYRHVFDDPFPVTRGQELGLFGLGSTIVVLFEADGDFEFHVKAGTALKYGQAIG